MEVAAVMVAVEVAAVMVAVAAVAAVVAVVAVVAECFLSSRAHQVLSEPAVVEMEPTEVGVVAVVVGVVEVATVEVGVEVDLLNVTLLAIVQALQKSFPWCIQEQGCLRMP